MVSVEELVVVDPVDDYCAMRAAADFQGRVLGEFRRDPLFELKSHHVVKGDASGYPYVIQAVFTHAAIPEGMAKTKLVCGYSANGDFLKMIAMVRVP